MKRIWQRLSPREKGLVILTFLILVLVLGRYLLIAPFLERREWVKSQLEIQPQLLEKNLRYLGQKEKIAADLEKAKAELKSLEPSLLSGDTASVSASDLQQAVQRLAGEGAQVISTRVLNPEPMGSFTRIPIQIEISGPIEQVTRLIKGIETAEKLLIVNELNVRSLFTPVAAVRPQGAPPVAAQNLRASLTISGFTRPQPAAPAKKEPEDSKAKLDEGKSPARSKPQG